jgi:hypothetical protein
MENCMTNGISGIAGANTGPPNTRSDDAIAAAGAEAARIAAQPLDPQARAIKGFRIANSTSEPVSGTTAIALADAAANARTALSRTDLSPERAAQVKNVVERLGNAVIDGKIEPHINNQFREHLRYLAVEPDIAANSAKTDGNFRGALAQLTRAVEVLDKVELARGTQLVYDAGAHQPADRAGLPILRVPDIDADLYFMTKDGVLHIESTKYGANTLASTIDKSLSKKGVASEPGGIVVKPESQLGRQTAWQTESTSSSPRAVGYYVLDKHGDFTALLEKKNLAALEGAVCDPGTRNVVIGDRAYSVKELKQMGAEAEARASTEYEPFKKAWEKANPGEVFKPRTFYREVLGSSPEARMKALGKNFGEPVGPLKAIAQPDLPSARQGAAFGALAAGGMTLLKLGLDGKLSFDKVGEVTRHSATGAAAGAVMARGERLVTPLLDRAIGPAVERSATQIAAKVVAGDAIKTASQKTASAAAAGFATRTLATRALGSTAVGVVVAAGVSAYENRQGLAHGESKAIGNVTADATVGAVSVAAGTAASIGAAAATGALIGSSVPVAGTIVGAVVGLGVGVGIAYGAQICGARDAVAHTVSGWTDKVKGWF